MIGPWNQGIQIWQSGKGGLEEDEARILNNCSTGRAMSKVKLGRGSPQRLSKKIQLTIHPLSQNVFQGNLNTWLDM